MCQVGKVAREPHWQRGGGKDTSSNGHAICQTTEKGRVRGRQGERRHGTRDARIQRVGEEGLTEGS